MSGGKLIDLLESLKQATIERRVRWSPILDGTNGFAVMLKASRLDIVPEATVDNCPAFSVCIRDETARAVNVEFFVRGEEQFALVREMYDLARNNALKIDEIIDSMIQEVAATR